MENQFLLISIGIIFFWILGLTFYLYKILDHYKKLINGAKKESLLEVLEKILKDISENRIDTEELRKEIVKLKEENLNHIKKVSILRFNPFSDTGGDQSFVLVILDGKETGVVLTSLHGRDVTRWYAKNVKEGKGVDHDLSDEEIRAIKECMILKDRKEKKSGKK